MASIPLPALDVRPPQQADTGQMFERAMALKTMMGQQQLQQSALQTQELQRQQEQMAIQQQQAGMKAMQQWDGKDFNELPNLLMKNGANLQTVMNARQGIVKYQQDLATLGKDQLATLKENNDFVAGQIDNIKGLPPEQQPQAFAAARQAALNRPGWTPEQRQSIQGMQYGGPEQLDLMEKQFMGHDAMIADALKTAQTGEAAARAKSAEATAEKTQMETSAMKQFGGLSPDFLRSKYIALTQKQEQGIPLSPMDRSFLASYQKEKQIVPQFNFNLQSGAQWGGPAGAAAGPTGDDFLKTLNQRDAGTLRALATGRMALPSSFALRTPYWQRMIGLLNQYDPNFSEQRAQVRSKFLIGKQGDNIRALNTATVHLGSLLDAAQALGNGTFTPGNAAYQNVKEMFGSSAPTTFDQIKNAVAGEMAAALKGNATDIEIANVEKGINRASSPQQLHDVITTGGMHILRQKLNTYQQQYQTLNPDDQLMQNILLTPQAKEVFEQHGIGGVGQQGGGISVTDPRGVVHSFPNQAAANAFKKAAGIQ